ncbi:hypothetical protein PVK06_027688 [Gossypium arboreum]|uniref:Uncharacterized protein n=1 Tax=Gossypium arboreum TaxID=29729 RepID=A0ABR0P0Y0_GOSAR|nr:hypothetical protein PVK06_027688 [Gossypium arboreum]
MSDRMERLMKMMQEISKTLPLRKEDMSDTQNLDDENPYMINNPDEIDGEIQPELVIEDNVDELNIVKMVSDPIDITIDVAANVKVEVTTNMELKLVVDESVKEPIHFLAIVEKVQVKEIDEFASFSSSKGNKTRVTKTSHSMERMKLKAIIPQKII